MKIFSIKSIGLYGLAIGGAIGFFHLVTSYGEAQIKAPISISGNYLIAGQELPGCLQHKSLLFKLQQSGVYLNANLTILDKSAGADILKIVDRSGLNDLDLRPTFSGRLQDRIFNLSGRLPPTTCPQLSQLTIVGSLAQALASKNDPEPNQQQQFSGQLSLESLNKIDTLPVKFTGMSISSIKSDRSH
jgi:hypothetical protein